MEDTRKRKLSAYEEFEALSDAEKEKVWESFNREIPFSETQPLSAADRRLHARARARARGRAQSKTGEGAEAVTVAIDPGLLRRADAYAKANGLTRAELVARGLSAVVDAPAVGGSATTTPRPRRRKAS